MIDLWSHGVIASQWRWLFSVGIAAAAVVDDRRPQAPRARSVEKGRGRKGNAPEAGSLVELFGDPRWRPRAIVGLLLAASGVVGLWGIGVFSNDLTQSFIGAQFDDTPGKTVKRERFGQFVASCVASPESPRRRQGQNRAARPVGRRCQATRREVALYRSLESSG